MGLHYLNLTPIVRSLMVDEIAEDLRNEKLYPSSRLTANGKRDYPGLLTEAATNHSDEWLESQLKVNNRLEATETRTKNDGTLQFVRVPVNAAETLAEGEFNRFYIRGLCRFCIENKHEFLEVYRAKEVENPRPESISKIGILMHPSKLLEDIRNNIGINTALGVPSGPNSGLSVKIPR